MNFVSSHQIFQLLCNKAIPVSSTGMTPLGAGMTGEGGAAVLDEKAGSQWALLHR
ncbi:MULTISPECIES: hypothetical protein [unclassified Wolbachia]|uniref:hypothetical protein n=1 Tax=unclassified Wolbachia TaxID=2640676 RepID=UPI0030D5E26A